MSLIDMPVDARNQANNSLDSIDMAAPDAAFPGLHVHYQSIVDRRSAPVSAEALVRMQVAHRPIGADAVIRHCRKHGLLCKLGREVHRIAIQEFSAAHGLLATIPRLHLNVSAEELSADGFSTQLLDTLAINRVPNSAITLELTEDAPLRITPAVAKRLRKIREAGIGLAVDDFGTGYNQLSILRDLPATHLKLARHYIAGIQPDDKIVGGIVKIATDLGMVVVAEGVEDQRQFSILADLGCDQFQGYYFSRPMPALRL